MYTERLERECGSRLLSFTVLTVQFGGGWAFLLYREGLPFFFAEELVSPEGQTYFLEFSLCIQL